MPRDGLTRDGLESPVGIRALGVAVASVVFVWWLLGSSVGAFGVRDAVAASVGQVTEYSIPTAHSDPYQIAAGPDGNLWFTESGGSQIGRITPTGELTEYSVPTADGQPEGIAAGPDGNLWFTDEGIGRITPAGQITEYPTPTTDGDPGEIVAGPDDNLWFTDDDGIGRITLSGQITQYSLPSPSFAVGIMAAPDGDVWFTDVGSNAIGRITTGSGFTRPGQVTEYPIPTPDSGPNKITRGRTGMSGSRRSMTGPWVPAARSGGSRRRGRSPSTGSQLPSLILWGSRPALTAISGSPRLAGTRLAGSLRSGRSPSTGSRPRWPILMGSRLGPTATSGSRSTTAGTSGGFSRGRPRHRRARRA